MMTRSRLTLLYLVASLLIPDGVWSAEFLLTGNFSRGYFYVQSPRAYHYAQKILANRLAREPKSAEVYAELAQLRTYRLPNIARCIAEDCGLFFQEGARQPKVNRQLASEYILSPDGIWSPNPPDPLTATGPQLFQYLSKSAGKRPIFHLGNYSGREGASAELASEFLTGSQFGFLTEVEINQLVQLVEIRRQRFANPLGPVEILARGHTKEFSTLAEWRHGKRVQTCSAHRLLMVAFGKRYRGAQYAHRFLGDYQARYVIDVTKSFIPPGRLIEPQRDKEMQDLERYLFPKGRSASFPSW